MNSKKCRLVEADTPWRQNPSNLFRAQRLNRIHQSRPGCLEPNGAEHNNANDPDLHSQNPETHVNVKSIVLQPSGHHEPPRRRCHQKRDEYQSRKLFAKYPENMGNTSAQNLADTDLFCLLQRHERHQSIQPQATDEQGYKREHLDECNHRLFRLVKFCGQVVQKVIRVDLFRVHVEPGLLQGGQRLPRIFHIDLHSEGVEIFPRGRNENRIDLRVKGLVMKIFYDTYHGPCPIAIYPEMPPENILGRRKVKLMHHCLVHEKFPDRIGWGEVSPRYEVDAKS